MPPKKSVDVKKKVVSELPQVPDFVPLDVEEHEAIGLPVEYCTSPLSVFNQLFTQEVWESLCNNTNMYYKHKSNQLDPLDPDMRPRPWKDTTIGELKVWLGLVLYMGVVSCPAVEDYWDEDTRQPPMGVMSLNRFEQLKRYLHVSPPVMQQPVASASASATTSASTAALPSATAMPEWWEKMEPMSSIVQARFKECYFPASNVAIDEMMVKCQGRSMHTLKMPNKPIDQGYKLFALADHGYTYSWIYYSRVKGAAALKCK